MVVCSPVDPAAKVVHDPVVIFEVLSPSTAAKDRIVKAREYQATPSVKRYVMLEQERIGATVLVRAQDGWSALILKDDDTLDMPEIGLEIPLAEFYEGLAFEAQPVEDRQRPAAARHRLIGFLTDRSLTPNAWARRRGALFRTPASSSVTSVDIPFRCSMKSARQKADAGPPCPRSIAT